MTARRPDARAVRTARLRDRRVYIRSHPVLFALLAAVRRRPVLRIGRTVVVNDAAPYRHALTRIPLDRTAGVTTGGVARELSGGAVLFDQDGPAHRDARRRLAAELGAAGVERLRPLWREVLTRGLAPLGEGGAVDLVPLAREMAGTTARALLCTGADPNALAEAAAEAASAAVREHLPGPARPGAARAAVAATARLEALLAETPAAPGATAARCPVSGTVTGTVTRAVSGTGPGAETGPGAAPAPDPLPGPGRASDTASETTAAGFGAGLSAMLAVAAVSTTVAALPRAAAWCADAGLWEQAADDALRPVLAGELLRVTAPSPLLPRAVAADAVLDGRTVRAGDRLLLLARHAARAHQDPPDAHRPQPPALARLVFGAGPHTCPGALLALAQLDDLLAALAPHRPEVVGARADRRAALPAWRSLVVRATNAPAPGRNR